MATHDDRARAARLPRRTCAAWDPAVWVRQTTVRECKILGNDFWVFWVPPRGPGNVAWDIPRLWTSLESVVADTAAASIHFAPF